MSDLKKTLLDLAESVQYADMYDLTGVPKILKQASDKIEILEMQVIMLLDRIEESKQTQTYSSSGADIVINCQPFSDRARIKSDLDDLGVEYSIKDNTQRLARKLQKALRGL